MPYRWPWAKTWYEDCGDGTRQLVHKNPRDAIPLFGGVDWEKRKAVSVAGVQELTGKVELEAKAAVKGLMVHIDEANASMQAKFLMAYTLYQSSACSNAKWFRETIEKIMDEETGFRLRKFDIEVKQLITLATKSPEQLLQEVDRAQHRLGTPQAELERLEAFVQARDQTREWKVE